MSPLPSSRARLVAVAGAVVLGLVAVVLLDAGGIGSFRFRPWAPLVCGAAVATASAALWPRALGRPAPFRQVLGAAVLGGAAAFVLGRAPFGSLDLGPLGAGSPGELPLVLLPFASVVGAVLGWPARRGDP